MATRRARLLVVAVCTAAAAVVAATAAIAGDDDRGGSSIRERLSGFEETPLALSTTGTGQFRARINERAQEIRFTLSYSSLESAVTQAHIHFGSESQTGGVSVFLCSNLGNGPAGTQLCPAAPAEVSGTIRPADVVGPSGQGIGAGEFAELIRAIRAGSTYVNVHSVDRPVGEIRGQIDHDHDHD